jgi:thiamine biosynthesis lipoprotein
MTEAASQPQTLAQEAMATVFTVTAAHPDPAYARQAIRSALDELDWLEDRLSRFRPSSDIARLGRLGPGERITVAPETAACLAAALAVGQKTGGAFDIAYLSKPASGSRLDVRPEDCTVGVLCPGLRLDLGGIGKGFALDRMAALLADWDMEGAILWASTSTVLVLGTLPSLSRVSVQAGPKERWLDISLVDAAMSASGIGAQGLHIFDPRTASPAAGRERCHVIAPTAAEADALSTAFMVMSDDEVAAYCREHPEVRAYL